MNLLRTVAAAFSMYSAIPMPQFAWEEWLEERSGDGYGSADGSRSAGSFWLR